MTGLVRARPAFLPKYGFLHSRKFLLAGFGGLLLLLAYEGLDAARNLSHIRASNDSIQQGFLARNSVLNRIRADLYVSGTYLRDYILEPNAGLAERHRTSLEQTRREMDALLRKYETLVSEQELRPVANLKNELAGYWRTAEPALDWSAQERRDRGYAFLRDDVLPRRVNMIGIADRIDAVNEQQLAAGNARVSELFADLQRRFLITAGVTFGLGLLLAAFSISRVLALEGQTSERFKEILGAREELKILSSRIVEAQENERRALSRELHDEVGQTLSALMVGLSNVSAALGGGDEAGIQRDVETLRALASKSVNVVRNISLALRPSMLDDLGLLPALQWQAREVSRQTGMRVEVAVEESLDQLPDACATCIFRVVQEALRNTARHAGASNVRITVRCENSTVRLSVQDDGRGFDYEKQKGLGLLGMQERVSNLGGELRVSSEEGSGALLTVTLPLSQNLEKTLSRKP